MRNSLFALVTISLIILFNSCDTPINEYKPKSDEEKQIIALLNTYVEARNKQDLKGMQATFTKDGIYYGGMGGEFKASEFSNTDPEFWTSYGELTLYDPKITINGNVAKIALVPCTERQEDSKQHTPLKRKMAIGLSKKWFNNVK